jgi:hypothetical protein
MALVRNRVNALNVLGLRKVKHLPPNFNKMTLSLDYIHKLKDIDRWIYANLDSRYCVRQVQSVTDDNKMVMVIEIGMEDPKELTFLSLSCPYINP